MKKIISILLMLMMLASMTAISVSAAETKEFYVSVNGNDANDGSQASPFATVGKAQEAIKALASYPAGGVIVNISGGTYNLTTTWKIDTNGKEGAPIVYRAVNNEKVILSGNVQLDSSKWTAVTDADAKAKIPAAAINNVKQMDVSSYDLGTRKTLANLSDPFDVEGIWAEFVFDGYKQQMAKYPNTGSYIYTTTGAEGELTFEDSINSKITGEKNLRLMYWPNDYWAYNLPLKSFDGSKATFEKAEMIDYDGNAVTNVKAASSKRMYLLNSAAFLDTEGEYFIDYGKKLLFFYTKKDVSKIPAHFTQTKGNLIDMDNAQNITFEGITFDGGRRHCLNGDNVKNIILDNCVIKNFGAHGINFKGISYGVKVYNSEMAYIGSRGINLKAGNASKLDPSGVEIVNNEIHHLGTNYNFQPAAVYFNQGTEGSYGGYVANNYFHDMPSQAMNTTTECLVEYNEFTNCSYETSDYAVMYTGNGPLGHGTVVQYNYFHDNLSLLGNDNGYGMNAFYIDGGNGFTFQHNVVVNQHRNMFYISSGSFNRCIGNVFVGDPNSDSYENWPTSTQSVRIAAYDLNFTDEASYLGRFASNKQWLSSSNQAWMTKYPELKEFLTRDGCANPANNIVSNNLMVNCGAMAIDDNCLKAEKSDFTGNWETTSDPGFVDAKNGNYQLKADAEVFTKIPGFKTIDMSKMGLLDSDYVYEGKTSSTPAPSQPTADNSKISNAVVLQVNSPKAIANGKDTFIDVNNMEIAPLIIDSRTLVPARFISESFGGKVGWNNDTRQVAVVAGGKTVIMQIDNSVYTIDGVEYTMDVPPQIIGGRTLVPLRAMCEALGKKVFWDNKGLIVISNVDNILDSAADSAYIDSLITRTK